MDRTILHIDMDAFFAAIEVRDRAELKGKPVIVGGITNRGVVSTASYEARRFGVHSAMPIFQAREKCPHGIFLPVRMWRYKEMSEKIMEILENFTPLVEKVSIDEAYLDITGTEDLLGSPDGIARQIKERISREIRLTCSIGIAPNKFLAKVASDIHKPDGLTIIPPNEVSTFLDTLPVEKIPGAGKRTVEALRRCGLKTAGEIKLFDRDQLVKRFGKLGLRLHELSHGQDPSPVVPLRGVKSISSEETLPYDTGDLGLLMEALKPHAKTVARRLRSHGLRGKTITIKVKFMDFTAVTRARTIASATDSSKMIAYNALRLLADQPLKKKARLIGVEVSNLMEDLENAQMNLFPLGLDEERERKLDRAIDEIREKFGSTVIKRGGL